MSFDQFVRERSGDLRYISSATRREHSHSDVINEAWVLAQELGASKGMEVDFLDPLFQDLLIRHLYQRLVRYTEVKIRHGVRLDQAVPGDDEDASHPLLRTLASDEGSHPLMVLEREQHEAARTLSPALEHSQAVAYLVLLRHFGNSMRSVANYLLISKSYAYQRCARARLHVISQQQAPLAGPGVSGHALPRPWRRSRLIRVPDQLAFPFDAELPL